MFGLGDYLTFALLASFIAVVSGKDPVPALATGVTFVVLFVWLMRLRCCARRAGRHA